MYNNEYESWNARAGLLPANFAFFQWKSEEEDKHQIRRGLLRDNCPTRDVK